MNKTTNGILDNVNKFLYDIQAELGEVSKNIGNAKNLIGDVTSSISSALSFENIKLNIFGCDLKVNCPSSDYFMIQNGSGAAENGQQPRVGEVSETALNPTNTATPDPGKPFAQPSQNQEDLKPDLELY